VAKWIDSSSHEEKSYVSMMPKEMLNTLTSEEVLDMLMYPSSGGNAENRAFQQ
jgi:hypothetical protein